MRKCWRLYLFYLFLKIKISTYHRTTLLSFSITNPHILISWFFDTQVKFSISTTFNCCYKAKGTLINWIITTSLSNILRTTRNCYFVRIWPFVNILELFWDAFIFPLCEMHIIFLVICFIFRTRVTKQNFWSAYLSENRKLKSGPWEESSLWTDEKYLCKVRCTSGR